MGETVVLGRNLERELPVGCQRGGQPGHKRVVIVHPMQRGV